MTVAGVHRVLVIFIVAAVVMLDGRSSAAQTPRLDYRVVYASAQRLAHQLDEAGRDGYGCARLAQSDPGAGAPGVVVLLGRSVGGSSAPVVHLVITAGGMGRDLQVPLERAAADGFRLCGIVLDEEPPLPALVAIMVRDAAAPAPARHYGVEILTNYKDSLARLGTAGREGFRPVASAPVNNNRVPEMRSWLVVTEQLAPVPRDVVVRSASGANSLQQALNEQAALGYCVDLIWKEGNDAVAMMSRAHANSTGTCAYAVDTTSLAKIHTVSHRYVADVPFRAPDDHLIISERSTAATNDVEEDALPPLGPVGYVQAATLGMLGDHISRHHDSVPMSATVHRRANGSFILTTIVSDRSR
ncbi:MAG: hypothetical protein ABI634_17535 [Acidobacteriota bacterium]